MARYAIINNGLIENVCEWDGDTAKWEPPAGFTAEAADVHWQRGGAVANGVYTPPAPEPVEVTLDELLQEYHTPEQFAALRRADELAKTLAIGDPNGVLDGETEEELKALEAIGQFFFLQRISGAKIDLSSTKLFDDAAKLGVYGDRTKAEAEVTRLKEGRPAEKSEAAIEVSVDPKSP